jgi:hypothetical protein
VLGLREDDRAAPRPEGHPPAGYDASGSGGCMAAPPGSGNGRGFG